MRHNRFYRANARSAQKLQARAGSIFAQDSLACVTDTERRVELASTRIIQIQSETGSEGLIYEESNKRRLAERSWSLSDEHYTYQLSR
jgi:hypothetical protein